MMSLARYGNKMMEESEGLGLSSDQYCADTDLTMMSSAYDGSQDQSWN